MSRPPLGFRRLLLGLQAGAPAPATELAVEFAELFDAELVGLFLDNPALRHLAAMPFAREINPLGGGWRAIESDRMTEDLDLAVCAAERLFATAARKLARRRFEVVRGRAADALAARANEGDLLVIGAPAPSERAAEPFASLLRAAFASRASVMFAPQRRARSSGPVIALVAQADDPCLALASAIAGAAGEQMIVVELAPARAGMRAPLSRNPDAAARWLAAPGESLPQALLGLRERLAVTTRASLGAEAAIAMASARGVPVLSLDGAEDHL